MIKVLTIIIVSVVLVYLNFYREHFYYGSDKECKEALKIPFNFKQDNCCYVHTIVIEDYDKDLYGPKCLNTCIVEHVPKINFEKAINNPNKEQRKNVLQYNRDNTTKGFCHSINNKDNFLNKLIDKEKCNKNSRCTIKDDICQEKNINYLSNASILNKTNCSKSDFTGCVNKYIKNINTIKGIYENYEKKTTEREKSKDKCSSS